MENIAQVLENGSSEEKIQILEKLESANEPEILDKIISKLDDDDIQVRGEAFSSLVLNKNKISNFLIKNLKSASKNIRGFSLLVLANRNEVDAIPEIIKLVGDERSMVRTCAIGALNFLKAKDEREIFLKSINDQNLEVRKSAVQAIIDLKIPIKEEQIDKIITENDIEIENLILQLKN
ncbi:HEAT repeat domain-containing protein [Nitrosopumilus sp.]|uniref:HEAT repeat domain-containing protein n=1 Tax=Nitrosopumilus sp. TaxID=2024843 RepID=UPI002638AC98|nr:HEAT repeat domain-containing protein [Nitrosopumilus sp.]